MSGHGEGNAHGNQGGGGAHGEGGEHKKHKKHHPHRHEEHEHEEGWIVSFADNVLLMMGFFVILLALNMGPKGGGESEGEGSGSPANNTRLLDFAIAVRSAFNNPVKLDSSDPADQALIQRILQRQAEGDLPTPGPKGIDRSAQSIRPSDWIGEDGLVRFAEGESDLNADAKLTIAAVAKRVVDSRWMVEVRGHTSRWETWGNARKARDLSYERAWSVASELVRLGATWDQIRLTACGENEPLSPGARNAAEGESSQRAEVLVLRDTVAPLPFNADR